MLKVETRTLKYHSCYLL